MVLKPGSTGLCGPDDFELKHGYDDDGETWAGNRVLKVMEDFAVIDAVVIVSRWCMLLLSMCNSTLITLPLQVRRRFAGPSKIYPYRNLC